MSETPFPASPVDLEVLDQFLMSDSGPEDCMQLSDLDGFLTGIVPYFSATSIMVSDKPA